MNAQSKIDTGTMTSKGQILIPKAMRDAAGLVPGQPYKVVLNEAGQVVVAPLGFSPEEAAERSRRVRDAINAHLRDEPISVVEAMVAADGFHARISARERVYLYRILNRRPPLSQHHLSLLNR